jgi:hypothetical protein
MTTPTYNGYTNEDTFNFELAVNNDRELYAAKVQTLKHFKLTETNLICVDVETFFLTHANAIRRAFYPRHISRSKIDWKQLAREWSIEMGELV